MAQTTPVGSRSLTGRRKYGLGWLIWAALALLALLALLMFLVIRNLADDGDQAGVDARNDPAAATATTAAPAAPAAPAGGQQAQLSAGGGDLFQLAAGGGLASLAGQQAQGRGVTVESVVADEGFWVGQPGRRVFVFLTPQARTRAGESPFQVQPGQRINLTGTVRPVPADVTPFGVDRNEGADELRRQGHFVEATTVQLT